MISHRRLVSILLFALVFALWPTSVSSLQREQEIESITITGVSPGVAFHGSEVALEIKTSPRLVKRLAAAVNERTKGVRAVVLVDGRRAPIVSFRDRSLTVRIPAGASAEPVIELRLEQQFSEAFKGLIVLPQVVDVHPKMAAPDTLATLITDWEIPPSFRPRVTVLVNGDSHRVEEFGKTGMTFLVPTIQLGVVQVGYTVDGVTGSSGVAELQIEPRPSVFVRVLRSPWFLLIVVVLGALAALRWWALRSVRVGMGPVEMGEHAKTDVPEFHKVAGDVEKLLKETPQDAEVSIVVEKISVENFKNVKKLHLDFTKPSDLKANWTCIAGINGSGKSSLLQAICILLLGEKLTAELGSERLRRMLRREGNTVLDARLEAWVRVGNSGSVHLLMPLNKKGVDELTLHSDPDYPKMRVIWDKLSHGLFVSYGPTRNLSEREEASHEHMAERVQRQMTLFDPLTRIAGVDVLVKGGKENERKLTTLRHLLEKVLGGEELAFKVSSKRNRLVFSQAGANLEAIDLPDGFRSTVAWLADLCSAWHDTAAEGQKRDTDPSKITGIVLIDEIGLHLHPSMSRSIVPQLRQALPNVQFFVTTHSPLVLSSFDRAELIILEADSEGQVGVRELDRQVFGFTMDEVYRWLMRTSPHSSVLEQKAKEGDDPNLALYLLQSGGAGKGSKGVDEEGARKLLDEMERLVEDLKDEKPNK